MYAIQIFELDVQQNINRRRNSFPSIFIPGYLSSPALRLLCLRPAVQRQQLLGVSQKSGSGCTTCLHLIPALPKVNLQQETQSHQLLTFQVYLLESIGSPAEGTVKSNQTAHQLISALDHFSTN